MGEPGGVGEGVQAGLSRKATLGRVGKSWDEQRGFQGWEMFVY